MIPSELFQAAVPMSEYQYYEFQAIDRPLSAADREALRALSTRARITTSSFVNAYEWGDFKGDPARLMEAWFDLHLYLSNWGSRRLMIRWPARTVDRRLLNAFLGEVDTAELRLVGENLILDIAFEEMDLEDCDDGSGWLAALAPLRADVLSGDLRLFYLIWLSAVGAEVFDPDELEPMPGIGPMTAALDAFAEFFNIDADLVAAAAERPFNPHAAMPLSSEAVRTTISSIQDEEKADLLLRLFEGDPTVTADLRARVHRHLRSEAEVQPVEARTVGELQTRASAIRHARERALAEAAAAADRKREAEAKRLRRRRLDALAKRGENVWREIEAEIERGNASGYDKAAALLLDLRAIADEKNTSEDFARRLRAVRERHSRKGRFIERLNKLG